MELRDLLRLLRVHWLSIVIATVAGGLLGFGLAMAQPRVYEANASGIITTGGSSDLGTALAGENLAKSRVKSYLDIAQSRTVATEVVRQLDLSTDPDSLIGQVTAENPPETAVIQVGVRAASPERARDIAEAWIKAIGDQVQELETGGGTGESIIRFSSLDAAVAQNSPSSPNVKLIIAVGLVIGLAVGLAIAFVRTLLDRRVRTSTQLEGAFQLPVVGTVPHDRRFSDDSRLVATFGATADQDGAHGVSEALRELRTNLQFMHVDNPPRVVVVTSSLPGEGKSTITANLAMILAQSGQPVVAIDGDLRRPTMARAFSLVPTVGLTDVLIGKADLSDVLQEVGETGNLQVLGAGPIPPNPSELLGSKAMQRVLEELSRDAFVLIDAPPLLPVTDAAILSAVTDGALVVARSGTTTLDALGDALGNIGRVNGQTLGLVLNGIPRRGADSTYYNYRYRSYYTSGAEVEAELDDTVIPGKLTPVPSGARISHPDDLVQDPKARRAL